VCVVPERSLEALNLVKLTQVMQRTSGICRQRKCNRRLHVYPAHRGDSGRGCNCQGLLTGSSNLATSMGLRGLRAPSEVLSLVNGGTRPIAGTSVSAAVVTGAIALLCSEFPRVAAGIVKAAITRLWSQRKRSLLPPLLDAWEAYQGIERG
jgi:hypothetical protein